MITTPKVLFYAGTLGPDFMAPVPQEGVRSYGYNQHMREMSSWSIVASLFFSISLCSSANEVVGSAVSLAGAGNPAAIEQSLSGFVSRMGGGVAMPQAVAAAAGHQVSSRSMEASRLERERAWVVSQGQNTTLPANLSGYLGLNDGKTPYPIKGLEWGDDNDNSTHWCEISGDDKAYMIIAYSPADKSYAINWLTDVSGKLYRTVYGDKTGMRVVPNTDYSAEFTGQMAYWDAITPGGTSVAANGAGH